MANAETNTTGWGLIAGNGRFPFLVLEGARSQGIEMAVIALKEEAAPELERLAKRLHWVSLGELSKAIDLMHQEGVTQAVMAGQVKHNKIFSSIRPDWKLAKLLFSLPRKNTDALIGAVARVLEDEGIRLVDSTLFLKPLVPEAGVLTRRAPDAREAADIAYGLGVARQISGLDIGQTVVISDRACVAVEAMEGTDETIARAARIAVEKPLVVVKVSKAGQDMRFDVPVIGLPTIEHMKKAKATALVVDAGRTLLFDRTKLIELADAATGTAWMAISAASANSISFVRSNSRVRPASTTKAVAFAFFMCSMVGRPITGTSKRMSCPALLTFTTTSGFSTAIRAARAMVSSVPSMASTATQARSEITTVCPMSRPEICRATPRPYAMSAASRASGARRVSTPASGTSGFRNSVESTRRIPSSSKTRATAPMSASVFLRGRENSSLASFQSGRMELKILLCFTCPAITACVTPS